MCSCRGSGESLHEKSKDDGGQGGRHAGKSPPEDSVDLLVGGHDHPIAKTDKWFFHGAPPILIYFYYKLRYYARNLSTSARILLIWFGLNHFILLSLLNQVIWRFT